MDWVNKPLVSVVTPFYNTEKYLAECIESVLAQSYDTWEYVLLNNCSSDRSYEIAQSYAKRDQRLRLVNNDIFLSQVQNYNRALRLISPESKYCKIVQADDWIFPDCIAEMVSVAENNPSVGIVASYWLNGTQVLGSGLPFPSTVTAGAAICKWHLLLFPEKYLCGTPTTLLFRSDLVRSRDPFYDETSLLEDYEACFELLEGSDFGFVHKILSYLRVDDDSLSAQIRDIYPYLLHAFICLKKYGPLYLTADEYNERLNIISKRYFEALAKGCMQRMGKEFWEYHMQGLSSIGYKLSAFTFMKYFVLELLDLMRHPKAAVRTLLRYLS